MGGTVAPVTFTWGKSVQVARTIAPLPRASLPPRQPKEVVLQAAKEKKRMCIVFRIGNLHCSANLKIKSYAYFKNQNDTAVHKVESRSVSQFLR